jgi:hypothetical protein
MHAVIKNLDINLIGTILDANLGDYNMGPFEPKFHKCKNFCTGKLMKKFYAHAMQCIRKKINHLQLAEIAWDGIQKSI